jgi:hypothetical protein
MDILMHPSCPRRDPCCFQVFSDFALNSFECFIPILLPLLLPLLRLLADAAWVI